MILLPYPVSANRYWRTFRGRQVVSAEAKAYKQEAGWVWAAARKKLLVGTAVHVEIELCPKLTKQQGASKTRMDLDNCIKVTLDALNKVAFADDSQVVSIRARVGAPIDGGGLKVDVRLVD